jgi:hypothetical protein
MRVTAALASGVLALVALGGALTFAVVCACSAASTATVQVIAGTYHLSLVDGMNGCGMKGINEGQVTPDIPLTVTQDPVTPQNVTVVLGGPVGTTLTSAVGTDEMTGTLGGSQVTLAPGPLDGSMPMGAVGNCMYSTLASLSLNFVGDTVQGTMTYSLLTNNASNCGDLPSCQTVQAIAGVLAPGDM